MSITEAIGLILGYMSRRQAGYTTAIAEVIRGLEERRPILIALTKVEADRISSEFGIQCISIHRADAGYLQGQDRPVLVDNQVLLAVAQEFSRLAAKLDQAEKKLANIRQFVMRETGF